MKTWFKFYGQEFLSDPKMLSLTALERSLWLTILCLASSSNEEGIIKYIDAHKIKLLTNLSPLDDEWDTADGFLEKFEELGMIKLEEKKIILINFAERQESNLTGAERQERYRNNHSKVTKVTQEVITPVTKVTLDKNREDKNREDKNPQTPRGELVLFLETFNKNFEKNYQSTTGRQDKLKKRLEKFTIEQILQALDNLTKSKFHNGENDRGWVADPDFLLRNDEQIDKWLNFKPEKQNTGLRILKL